MIRMIYGMMNNGYTGVRWKKTTTGVEANTAKLAQGLCFGYTVIWIVQMLSGESEETVPTIVHAGLIQQKWEVLWWAIGERDAISEVIQAQNYKIKQQISLPWVYAACKLSLEQGFFLVNVEGVEHIVGMGRTGDKFYYFDPNEGLFCYDSSFEFISEVNVFFKSLFDNWIYKDPSQFCKCYRIEE